MSALLIVPTRGRPDRIAATIDGWREHSTAGTKLLLCLDRDDERLDEYIELAADAGDYGLRIRDRERMIPTLNTAAVVNAATYDYIVFMGDDHVVRTPGWDSLLAQSLEEPGLDGWGIAYGNDLLQGAGLATAAMVSSKIIRTLGYIAPPGLIHLYMDDAWMRLGEACSFLRYRPDVVVEHMHFTAGKSKVDDGYAEVNAPEMYSADKAVFDKWLRQDLPDAVARIQKRRGL
jgi:hypothetical protein